MILDFFKYQGTGNDFILIDDRNELYRSLSKKQIAQLCHRRFGIGADGLMLLRNKQGFDFEMVYFNSDGAESSMCGNGGRCISQFAHYIGIGNSQFNFLAIDGPHKAQILKNGIVKLAMNNVETIDQVSGDYVLNTGSPHYVSFSKNVENLNLIEDAKKIRNSEPFIKNGINVNFIEVTEHNVLKIRTYERGVEDETYSCGTGAVAAAVTYSYAKNLPEGINSVVLNTVGGQLIVEFEVDKRKRFTNIWLIGPAEQVFKGSLEID